jgi:hypothetical protein
VSADHLLWNLPTDWLNLRTVEHNPSNTSFFGLVGLWIVMEQLGFTDSLREARTKVPVTNRLITERRVYSAVCCAGRSDRGYNVLNWTVSQICVLLGTQALLSSDETAVITLCTYHGIRHLVTIRTTGFDIYNAAFCPQSMFVLLMFVTINIPEDWLHSSGLRENSQIPRTC